MEKLTPRPPLYTFSIIWLWLASWQKINCVYLNGTWCRFLGAQALEKGEFMFEVTEKAGEVIRKLLEGKGDPQSVRIMMTEGGW